MSASRKLDAVCLAVLALMLAVTALFMCGDRLGLTRVVDEDAEQYSSDILFTANDLAADWDTSSATVIALEGGGVTISGGGAYAYDGGVVISEAGRYVISGELTDGAIVVDAHRSSKVWLLLDGVTVACSDEACLQILKADKVFVTLADGTETVLTGPDAYDDEDQNGVIYAKDDLTINGGGSLTIRRAVQYGISANDDLVIAGGMISIEAEHDAIHVHNSFRLTQASVLLTAGDDGVAVTGEDGYFYQRSGSLTIVSADDAVHTTGTVTLAGGSLTVDAGGDAVYSASRIDIAGGTVLIGDCYEGFEAPVIEMSGGDVTIYPRDDGFNAGGEIDDHPYIRVSGGSVTIVNETARDADGFDSNGDLYIEGGVIRISLVGSGMNCALDYGSENGGVAVISGGTVIACGSSTMAQGFASTSSQPSVLFTLSEAAEAGSTIELRDGAGNTLLSWEVPCSFTSAVLSCPDMALGASYDVVIGKSTETVELGDASTAVGTAQSAAPTAHTSGAAARPVDPENDDDVEIGGPKALSELGLSVWLLLAASAAVLLAGLWAAFVLRDRIK